MISNSSNFNHNTQLVLQKPNLLLTHPILAQSDFTLLRFCNRCGHKFIPVFARFRDYCPVCNKASGNVIDLIPSFENIQNLINGGLMSQIFRVRRSSKKFEREQLIKNIRNKVINELHCAGIFTYDELEIFFGLSHRRLNELSNMDHENLLTKNCPICGTVMEFGNNYFLYEHKKFCCPECKSKSRRKEFRYLRNN